MICFTCSMHFLSLTMLPFPSGVNTIIDPLPQPLCADRIARFVSVTSKLTFMLLPDLLVKRNITLDAVMLQRFTQHTLQIHAVLYFLCRKPSSHNPLDTWTQHFQSQQLVDHLDIQRRKAFLLWTCRFFHECQLAHHSHQRLSSTNSAAPSDPLKHCCTLKRKTHELLDPNGDSQNHHPLGHHRQIQLFDVLYQNLTTCAVHLRSEIQPGPGCGSFFLDVFFLPLPLPLLLPLGWL